jgi:hypothetical protein
MVARLAALTPQRLKTTARIAKLGHLGKAQVFGDGHHVSQRGRQSAHYDHL